MIDDCDDGNVDPKLLRDGRMSFHYFHPMVSEILMYPTIPPPPYGRESLEWYQISAMRHRNPQMMTYGELENVWDKMINPERDNFLSKHDYQQILTLLQDNIMAKGAGKHNINWRATAHPMTQNAWNETLADIVEDTASNTSTSDNNRPPREELHAYLAPVIGHKGKGKGGQNTMRLLRQIEEDETQTQRQRTGEPWNRRQRRAEASNADYEAWRQGSTHSSMPDLLEDAEDDDAVQDEHDVEITPDGNEIAHI